jgi:hypothetical protein
MGRQTAPAVADPLIAASTRLKMSLSFVIHLAENALRKPMPAYAPTKGNARMIR